MLSGTSVSPDFSLQALARRTDGLSGSDLKETCRNAAMRPVRELMRSQGGKGMEGMEEAKKNVSAICTGPGNDEAGRQRDGSLLIEYCRLIQDSLILCFLCSCIPLHRASRLDRSN